MQRPIFFRACGNGRSSIALAVSAAVWLGAAAPAIAQVQDARIDGFFSLGPPPTQFATDDDRLARLTGWLEAVADHRPGQVDAALARAASWKFAELQGLAIDTAHLALLMRNPRLASFSVESSGYRTRIVYTPSQLRRLRALACAGGGYLTPVVAGDPRSETVAACLPSHADLPPEAAVASTRFLAERLRRNGDDNQLLFRAAILHADVAMLRPPVVGADDVTTLPVGPRGVRIEIADGQVMGLNLAALHWDVADQLLDKVRPGAEEKPSPQRDERVRAWYRATVLWMQSQEQYDDQHIEHAHRIFPQDPRLLFLLGCQHEAYASPAMEPGLRLARMTSRNQLHEADRYFAEALQRDPALPLAGLRRGRVLNLLGRYDESAAVLQGAGPLLPDTPQLQYFWHLFVGEAAEGRERFDAARTAFESAHALFPLAQKPKLALSQLEWRRDARQAALLPMAELFAQSNDAELSDPWESYPVSHAADAEAQIEALWLRFTGTAE